MRHVLKTSEVQFEGPLQLSLDPVAAPLSSGPSPTAPQARIRIAENHPEYALVEVTCSCGQTTYVRCEYEPAQA